MQTYTKCPFGPHIQTSHVHPNMFEICKTVHLINYHNSSGNV